MYGYPCANVEEKIGAEEENRVLGEDGKREKSGKIVGKRRKGGKRKEGERDLKKGMQENRKQTE